MCELFFYCCIMPYIKHGQQGGARKNCGRPRKDVENHGLDNIVEASKQMVEKRTKHQRGIITFYPSENIKENCISFMEKKRESAIENMNRIINKYKGVFNGFITQIEEMDWRKYRFPEKVWIGRHLMVLFDTNRFKYRQEWDTFFRKEGFGNFNIMVGNPSYPGYLYVYIFKDEHYTVPLIHTETEKTNEYLEWIKQCRYEHDTYPIAYRVESKDYDNKDDMNATTLTIEGKITKLIRNIMVQQHIVFRLENHNVILEFPDDIDECDPNKDAVWLYGYLINKEHRYKDGFDYWWKKILKCMQNSHFMITRMQDLWKKPCDHYDIDFTDLDPKEIEDDSDDEVF